MYGDGQPLNASNQFPISAGEDTNGGGDSIGNPQHGGYEAHGFEDTGVGGLDGVEAVGDAVYAYSSCSAASQQDVANQLTLSFRGQVYVFDSVTTDKVQSVLLLLGGCEFSPGTQGVELTYQNQPGFMDNPRWCSHPQRAASLSRFRQKRKERCFDKKIRYDVRQEVALRMHRKKGQFASSKKSEGSVSWDAVDDSGQDDSPAETLCTHCGTSSKSTPMMRRGPAGPRTLCNACGLFWVNRGMLRNLSKKVHDNVLTLTEQGEAEAEADDSDFDTLSRTFTGHVPFSNIDNSTLVAEQ